MIDHSIGRGKIIQGDCLDVLRALPQDAFVLAFTSPPYLNVLQHPYPGYYYPSLVAEYVFVFQKPATKKDKENIYWYRTEEEKEKNKIDLSAYQGEMSKNVWKIRPLSPQENIHPCPFPLELAERVVNLYSYKGDAVIDIFAGSGQTNLASERLQRQHVGIEIMPEYIEYALKRLRAEISQGKMF
ncbi:MAG: site-specific DNA-methyltransferase [Chloroflexi bacterium]|nr:site-specific DNA-methyltransferase [Chloroflexota bacterium]